MAKKKAKHTSPRLAAFVLIALLTGCTTTRWVNTGGYWLESVDTPDSVPNPTLSDDGVYADDDMTIRLEMLDDCFALRLANRSGGPIRIVWRESSYTDELGEEHPLKHTEATDYDRLTQHATTIASGTTLNAKGITVNGAYKECVTINGGTISLGSSGIEMHEADLVVNSAMVANDSQTWSGEDGYSITVGSLNVGSGKTLTLGGEGDVFITAASTFSGNLSVQSGDLWLQKSLSSGNFSMGDGSMLHPAGAGMIAAKDISLGKGAGIDLSNFLLTSHRDITLATATGSIDTAHLSDVKLKNYIAPAGYNATLKADGNKLNLAFTPVQAMAKDDLGNVMYVGDSITDGVNGQASWRYAFFKILTDVGVTQNEEGYYQHTQTSGKITTAEYDYITS